MSRAVAGPAPEPTIVLLVRKRPVERERELVPLLEFAGDGDFAYAVGLTRGDCRLSVRYLGSGPNERDACECAFHFHMHCRKPFSVPPRLPSSLMLPGFQPRAMSMSAATFVVNDVMST